MFCWKIDPANYLVKHRVCSTFWSLGLTLLFFACAENRESSISYYPIDSLLTAQVEYLKGSTARLTKIAVMGEHRDSITYTPGDSVAWADELDIFALLNSINKPVYQGQYEVEDGIPDHGSNLKVLSFKAKKKIPVSALKIFYQDVHANVRKVEAVYQEENPLYKSSRTIHLELHDVQNQSVLSYYTVEGGQKMILKDSVEFLLQGIITLH